MEETADCIFTSLIPCSTTKVACHKVYGHPAHDIADEQQDVRRKIPRFSDVAIDMNTHHGEAKTAM